MLITELTISHIKNRQLRNSFFKTMNAIPLSEETTLRIFKSRKEIAKTYIAIENEQIIGTISLILEPKYTWGGIVYGHIEDVNVIPSHRHKNIGTEIVKHAMNEAKKTCSTVMLDCQPNLRNFYAQHGFAKTGICMKFKLSHISHEDESVF